jgi:predicted GIY-YIG superfamily endonuclease
MTTHYVYKMLHLWRTRAIKAEKRVKQLEEILKENNVRFEPDSS